MSISECRVAWAVTTNALHLKGIRVMNLNSGINMTTWSHASSLHVSSKIRKLEINFL